jgi:hypothetical protein
MPTRMMVGRAVRVAPGDVFMMTVSYDNPTGRMLEGSAMGTFGAVFIPDDLAQWPALDANDPAVRRDLAYLRSPAQRPMRQGGGHQHH